MTIRIVLADDHRMLRETLRRSMEDEGFSVVGEAADADEAVNLALDWNPDVVLMDVSLGTSDGVEATARIVKQQPATRVVMLTMHADRDVIARAIRAGASAYLVKDCSIDEVVATIRQVASGETALSAEIAVSMLNEVRALDGKAVREEDRIITKREEEVLQLIADGCSTPEVAARLYISQKTVKNHLASIYEKLDARDRTQAVLQAVRMGIVRLS